MRRIQNSEAVEVTRRKPQDNQRLPTLAATTTEL